MIREFLIFIKIFQVQVCEKYEVKVASGYNLD